MFSRFKSYLFQSMAGWIYHARTRMDKASARLAHGVHVKLAILHDTALHSVRGCLRVCSRVCSYKHHQNSSNMCEIPQLLCNHVQPINDKWTHVNTTSFHGRKKWRHYVTLCSCHKGYNHKLQSSHGKKAGLLASNRAITFALTRRSYFLGNSIHVQVQILVVVCQWCLMIQDWWPMNPQVYKHHIYKYNHILHSSSNMQVYMNTWAMTSRSSV